jgi:sugar O-acyltransferase (sialic acid O-acetyltransferase NeuD family)
VSGTEKQEAVFVYGASGHGKVVADILRACCIEIEGFIDDTLSDSTVNGFRIAGNAQWLALQTAHQHVSVALGIGDNFARQLVALRCIASGIQLVTAVHPSAVISSSAKISPGTVIMAQAVVNADAVIGEGAIINTAAIVEHDCSIGNFAHLSPKAAIGGHVQIGDLSWLGIGSSVTPNIRVGAGSIVGAGATVVHDVEDGVVVVGTPARTLKKGTRQIEAR